MNVLLVHLSVHLSLDVIVVWLRVLTLLPCSKIGLDDIDCTPVSSWFSVAVGVWRTHKFLVGRVIFAGLNQFTG